MASKMKNDYPPTSGCINAAEYFIDFETQDGVSNAFKQSLEDMPSEHDAVQTLARHINNATRSSELLLLSKAASATFTSVLDELAAGGISATTKQVIALHIKNLDAAIARAAK